MSVWVINASPLILLGKINQLPLLARLAAQVVIPPEVAGGHAWLALRGLTL